MASSRSLASEESRKEQPLDRQARQAPTARSHTTLCHTSLAARVATALALEVLEPLLSAVRLDRLESLPQAVPAGQPRSEPQSVLPLELERSALEALVAAQEAVVESLASALER